MIPSGSPFSIDAAHESGTVARDEGRRVLKEESRGEEVDHVAGNGAARAGVGL